MSYNIKIKEGGGVLEEIKSQYIPYVMEIDDSPVTVLFFKQRNEDIMELLVSTALFEKEVLIYAKFVIIRKNSDRILLQLLEVSRCNVQFNQSKKTNINSDSWVLVDGFDNMFAKLCLDVINSSLMRIGYDFYETILIKSFGLNDKVINEILEEQHNEYIEEFITLEKETKDELELLEKIKNIIEVNFFHLRDVNNQSKNIFRRKKQDKRLKELEVEIIDKSIVMFNHYYKK